MHEDKTKPDNRDRSRVPDEEHEVAYLVKQVGVQPEHARALIRRYGNNRETLIKHAWKLI